MENNKEQEAPAWLEAIMFLLMLVAMGALFVSCMAFRVEQAKEIIESHKKEVTTEYGHLIGKVKTIENYKGDKPTFKEGEITITFDIYDRTKITFEDGRTKEVLGIPSEALPKDREIVVIWAKYDLYMRWMEVEEYKKLKGPYSKEIVPENDTKQP